MRIGTTIAVQQKIMPKAGVYVHFVDEVPIHELQAQNPLLFKVQGKSVDKFLIAAKLSTEFSILETCTCLVDTMDTHLHTPFNRM